MRSAGAGFLLGGWWHASILYLCMFFLTRTYCAPNSSPHWASQRAGMMGDGWEGRAQADGLVGPNGPKASLYPTGA